MTDSQVLTVFYQILKAISYIHKLKILHRDIKPENILMEGDFHAKLCDFGFCAPYGEGIKRKTMCGTSEYLPPEIINGSYQTEKVDIWCMGILLYELLHKTTPFKKTNLNMLLLSGKKPRIRYKGNINVQLRTIIERCIDFDPRKRPSADEILSFPIFNQFKQRKEKGERQEDEIINLYSKRKDVVKIERDEELRKTHLSDKKKKDIRGILNPLKRQLKVLDFKKKNEEAFNGEYLGRVRQATVQEKPFKPSLQSLNGRISINLSKYSTHKQLPALMKKTDYFINKDFKIQIDQRDHNKNDKVTDLFRSTNFQNKYHILSSSNLVSKSYFYEGDKYKTKYSLYSNQKINGSLYNDTKTITKGLSKAYVSPNLLVYKNQQLNEIYPSSVRKLNNKYQPYLSQRSITRF